MICLKNIFKSSKEERIKQVKKKYARGFSYLEDITFEGFLAWKRLENAEIQAIESEYNK